MNGFTHHYHLGEFILILGASGLILKFNSIFFEEIPLSKQNSPRWDATELGRHRTGTPRSAASHLGLFCLPMSHKRDARLKELNGKNDKLRKMNDFIINIQTGCMHTSCFATT